MLIRLHSQATTTPKIRAAIHASDEQVSVLAEHFGVTEQTVYKWRKRDSVKDRSHTPHRLQTLLTPAQEAGRGMAMKVELEAQVVSPTLIKEVGDHHITLSASIAKILGGSRHCLATGHYDLTWQQ